MPGPPAAMSTKDVVMGMLCLVLHVCRAGGGTRLDAQRVMRGWQQPRHPAAGHVPLAASVRLENLHPPLRGASNLCGIVRRSFAWQYGGQALHTSTFKRGKSTQIPTSASARSSKPPGAGFMCSVYS